MKSVRWSKLHLPHIEKVKVRKRHYRIVLICAAGGIWAVHEWHPHYEMHIAFLTNLLFALDPSEA